MLVEPALDAALAGVGPVAAQDKSIFFVHEVIGEPFAGRTNVNVPLSHVAKSLAAEAHFREFEVIGFGQCDCDACLLARQDLAAIGELVGASHGAAI
jgi:hypothetical protein